MKTIGIILLALATSLPVMGVVTPAEIPISEDGSYSYFVILKDQADLSPAKGLLTKAEKGRFVVQALRTVAEQSQKELKSLLESRSISYKSYWIQNMILVTSDREEMQTIASRSDVLKLVPNQRRQILDGSERANARRANDSRGVEWGVQQIRAPEVWDALGITGEGVIVCDNDTGVQWDHPALKEHYLGWDGGTVNHNYTWHDCTGTSPTVPLDDHGHGTHTTGTMVGDDGLGNQIGVAPGAKFIAVKNMDSDGGGLDAWFHDSFQWILAPTDLSGNNPDPGRAPHIVNNSWGFDGNDNQFYADISALTAAGIFVEVSAGNEGPDCGTLRSPADYDNVFTTGASQTGASIADFSSRGPSALFPSITKPDITAPGENIRSSVPGGEFEGGWSGTSMAGPHTCGMIALIWSANPNLIGHIDDTSDLIRSTAWESRVKECTGPDAVSPNMVFGYGEIDCYQTAVRAFAPASEGFIEINKMSYMCSDQVVILMKDSDLIGTSTIQVSVTSSTELIAEMVTLQSIDMNGVFSGAITIATGTPVPDGLLQVADSGFLIVMYHDENYGGAGPLDLITTGEVDCSDPNIMDVTVMFVSSDSTYITYTTDELTSTGIRFLPIAALNREEFHEYPNSLHHVFLSDLDPCTQYMFQVEAIDIAGNMTVDDNGGAYYSFETYKNVVIVNAPLNSDPGWDRSGQWEFGKPAGNNGDPASGYTGENVFGYNLSGAYENNMGQEVLETGPIDCSQGSNASISYALWLNVDAYPNDQASWEVSNDGGATWIKLFDNSWFSGPMMMDEWLPINVTMGELLDGHSDVRFRWTMGPTDGSGTYGGWNIDDIQVAFDAACDFVTPTPVPTASPTPEINLGVRLDIPEMVGEGDQFYITGYLDNPGEAITGVPVFFILEVYGDLWFWPGWKYYSPPNSTEMDFTLKDVATGTETIEVIQAFPWPNTGPDTVTGLHFYGAMLNPGMTDILGDYAFETFGYGP